MSRHRLGTRAASHSTTLPCASGVQPKPGPSIFSSCLFTGYWSSPDDPLSVSLEVQISCSLDRCLDFPRDCECCCVFNRMILVISFNPCSSARSPHAKTNWRPWTLSHRSQGTPARASSIVVVARRVRSAQVGVGCTSRSLVAEWKLSGDIRVRVVPPSGCRIKV